jgi:hypothetical protein
MQYGKLTFFKNCDVLNISEKLFEKVLIIGLSIINIY